MATTRRQTRATPATSDPRALLDARISEAQFQADLINLSTLRGWTHYHTYRSIKSPQGFPDLVLVRRARLVFAELKTQRGKLSAQQQVWIALLCVVAGVAPDVISVYVWRPSDWPMIEKVLA